MDYAISHIISFKSLVCAAIQCVVVLSGWTWFCITRYDVPVGVSSSSSSKSEHSCPMVLPRYILRGFACGLKILMGMVPSLTVATTYKIPVEYHSPNRFSSSRTPVILSITLPPATLPMIFVNREFKQARTQQQ